MIFAGSHTPNRNTAITFMVKKKVQPCNIKVKILKADLDFNALHKESQGNKKRVNKFRLLLPK